MEMASSLTCQTGRKVKYIGKNPVWRGKEGTVTEIEEGTPFDIAIVDFGAEKPLRCYFIQLEWK